MGVVLRAGELALRPWGDADVGALLLAHRDPLLRRRLVNVLRTEGEARAWLRECREGWADGTRFAFAVWEGAGLAGCVVLKQGGERAPEAAEIGYWTAGDARGRGVAPRAVEAVTAWAFAAPRAVPLTRIELLHDVENTASCRVAVKCGFAMETVLPPHPPKWPEPGHLHVRTRDRGGPA